MIQKNEDAVSPVIAVLLMLVVTIIIAAIVSGFAGGLAGDQKKTPQLSLTAKGIIQDIQDTDDTNFGSNYPTGWTAANGIEFENKGGDSFSLNNINIQLQAGGTKYTITPGDKLPSSTCLPDDITNGGYFKKVGDTSLYDYQISPGDKFMFYADNCYDNSNSAYGPSSSNGKYLVWHPDGVSDGIGVQLGKNTGYMIIDRVSNKVMSTGEFVFR
jgi:archaeal type IV pilus assembly protein PilA